MSFGNTLAASIIALIAAATLVTGAAFCAPPTVDASGEVIVSNVGELLAAFAAAEAGGPKTIIMQSGVYQLDDMIMVGTEGVTVRGMTGNRDDVVLDGGAEAGVDGGDRGRANRRRAICLTQLGWLGHRHPPFH